MCAHRRPNDQPEARFQTLSFSILHGLYDGIVERLLKTANQGQNDGVLVRKILIEGSNAHPRFRCDRVGVESTNSNRGVNMAPLVFGPYLCPLDSASFMSLQP
jgi:hypothetical protein